ncbi:unnamed protein product, partial [Chrysoparadoxa australica]
GEADAALEGESKIGLLQTVVLLKKAARITKRVRKRMEKHYLSVSMHDPRKIAWNRAVTLMVLYTVIMTPWRIAFNTQGNGMGIAIEVMIEACYWMDLVLGFLTGYLDDGVEVTNLELVTKR